MQTGCAPGRRRGAADAFAGGARFGLALWLLLAAGAGCGDGTAPAAQQGGPVLEQSFFDQSMVETQQGQRRWMLRSRRMDKYTGQQDVMLDGVTMDFYRDGEPFATLTADSGRANLQTRDVKVWGDVKVATTDGRLLQTQELYFDDETQLVTNDVPNRYTWDGGVATGVGIEASSDLEYFEIKRSFAGEVSEDGRAPARRP